MAKFTSQGTSYSAAPSFWGTLGGNIGAGYAQAKSDKAAEQKQLMQNLANNNRLSSAQENEPGSFMYGGQRLKVIDKPQTGQDSYYQKQSDNYVMNNILKATSDAYVKAYTALGDEEESRYIADQVQNQYRDAFGVPRVTIAPPVSADKKEKRKKFFGREVTGGALGGVVTGARKFGDFVGDFLLGDDGKDYKGDPNAPLPTSASLATPTSSNVNTFASKTPQQIQTGSVQQGAANPFAKPGGAVTNPTVTKPIVAPAQENVSNHVRSIKSKVPQPSSVDVEGMVKQVRMLNKKGVSKEMILRELGDFVSNPKAFYEEAIK